MISLDRRHIRTRLTSLVRGCPAVVVLVYSAAACFFLLRDLRSQLVRHAIQDIETVEGLLYFTPDGRADASRRLSQSPGIEARAGTFARGAIARRARSASKRVAGKPVARRHSASA